jgi:hypothetical protein
MKHDATSCVDFSAGKIAPMGSILGKYRKYELFYCPQSKIHVTRIGEFSQLTVFQ